MVQHGLADHVDVRDADAGVGEVAHAEPDGAEGAAVLLEHERDGPATSPQPLRWRREARDPLDLHRKLADELTDALREAGFRNTAVLDEGVQWWEQQGYPIER